MGRGRVFIIMTQREHSMCSQQTLSTYYVLGTVGNVSQTSSSLSYGGATVIPPTPYFAEEAEAQRG